MSKRIGEQAIVSTDYTFESGKDTLRQALRVNTPEFKPLDFFRVEVTRGFKNDFPVVNRTRFELFLTYNLLGILRF